MEAEQVHDSQREKTTLVCPWQIVRLFDNVLRPLVHNPRKLFGPYVREGMTVLDIGCGRGFASLGLAKLVGEDGLVISADLQPEMLEMVRARAARAGLSTRIRIHHCETDRIGVKEELDFVVAFFMVHEVPDTRRFFEEIFQMLRPGCRLFFAEPIVHVSKRDFERTVQEAQSIGFEVSERTGIRIGRAVVLEKNAGEKRRASG
ncbi:MAG TPA: class I SAM-dependent methyltransferase [Dehalococcoidia bacterium]|nr:class I SAM-dependent methyltransferase [Dehalococcoidia bacterium]